MNSHMKTSNQEKIIQLLINIYKMNIFSLEKITIFQVNLYIMKFLNLRRVNLYITKIFNHEKTGIIADH